MGVPNFSVFSGGGAVTDLEAEQTAVTEVLVTWTTPSPAPPRGYQVTVAPASISDTASGNRHILTISQPGVHTIQVQPLSRHYPSEAMSVEVTVRGKAVRTIFLSATYFLICMQESSYQLLTFHH